MPAAVWTIIAVGLCVGELLTLNLVLLMLGGAALAAGATAFVTGALVPQLVAFMAASLLLLAGVRPLARRHLEVAELPSGTARLPGRAAVVVERVSEDSGQVRVDGELWRARPFSGGPELPAGTAVVVASVEGATLHVYQKELS